MVKTLTLRGFHELFDIKEVLAEYPKNGIFFAIINKCHSMGYHITFKMEGDMKDVFRRQSRDYSEEQANTIDNMKWTAENLLLVYESAMQKINGDQRLMALAKTSLEESVMWAVKAIT